MNVYSKISQNLTNLGHIIKIHFQFFNLKMIKIIIKVLLRNFFFFCKYRLVFSISGSYEEKQFR